MNSKYQNGKIYCIWSYETDEIYIGSTILSLDDRFKKHQNKYNLFLNNNFNFISSFEILKYKNAQIGIIEEYPCNTKLELHRREGELQKKIKCVNRHIAGRSRKEFYKDNKDILLEKQKIYYENNKGVLTKKQYQYNKKKYHSDEGYRLKEILAARIREALRKSYKSASTAKLIGCSIDHLKKHLEGQFKPGMTWDNHAVTGWHMDHIIACNNFDLTKSNEQKKCFNWKNLQPLWYDENIKKGVK